MADNFVRLGMVLAVIMFISVCFYQFGNKPATALEPNLSGFTYPHNAR